MNFYANSALYLLHIILIFSLNRIKWLGLCILILFFVRYYFYKTKLTTWSIKFSQVLRGWTICKVILKNLFRMNE